jgi:galactonate dehydratase
LFVQVHTDEELVGLGETFFGAQAVEVYIHETASPYLLGKDPLHLDRHAKELCGYLGYKSSGAETRGNSAIDVALWDLFGKVSDQPVYQLLGGPSRERIRTYNTCAGYRYVRDAPRQEVSNCGGLMATRRGLTRISMLSSTASMISRKIYERRA